MRVRSIAAKYKKDSSKERLVDQLMNNKTLIEFGSRRIPTGLKIDNLDRVSIPTKIVATFDVEHPIHTLMASEQGVHS